jgi:K+-sensing histidine kinase KdpD
VKDQSHWLDRIAHDLRGPLTPLQTAAWLLKSEREHLDAQRQQELLDIIERQSRRLGRMIDEIDDWARMQQQRLLGEAMPCELTTMLDLAISAIPGCMIEPQFGPGCAGASIECDQFRLVQAFQILIEYSCARDPNATVLVSRAEGAFIDVKLLDHAGAVDADAASQLFERPDHAPANEGLGLRLLLARAIVEAHGGTLVAEPTADGLLLRCRLRVSGSDRS